MHWAETQGAVQLAVGVVTPCPTIQPSILPMKTGEPTSWDRPKTAGAPKLFVGDVSVRSMHVLVVCAPTYLGYVQGPSSGLAALPFYLAACHRAISMCACGNSSASPPSGVRFSVATTCTYARLPAGREWGVSRVSRGEEGGRDGIVL